MSKKHWYCFNYSGKSLETYQGCIASTYTGYSTKQITMHRIKENKVYAGVTDTAVLVAVSYLGYMTKEEFTQDE